MSSANQRVVLDTNQIVGAGSRWLEEPVANVNNHRRLLEHVAGKHTGLYCTEIVQEYIEKLLDHRHPEQRAQKLITYIIGAFVEVQIVSSAAPVPPSDPDDEVFLICSLDGNADYLVSEDKGLLELKESYQRPMIGKCAELMGVLGIKDS